MLGISLPEIGSDRREMLGTGLDGFRRIPWLHVARFTVTKRHIQEVHNLVEVCMEACSIVLLLLVYAAMPL